ncbi:hypothetical protein ACH5RR_031921 [Cinchona calisaya]|uniref:Uncharacterized protein n=1 Tax=Cinchona calisaya TaxID=153742 RepID=A0ABD2YJB3_9GENT
MRKSLLLYRILMHGMFLSLLCLVKAVMACLLYITLPPIMDERLLMGFSYEILDEAELLSPYVEGPAPGFTRGYCATEQNVFSACVNCMMLEMWICQFIDCW